MKIKLKTLYASSKGTYQIGEVGEFGYVEGNALLKGGFGILMDKQPIETAVVKPVENAVSPVVKKEKTKTKKPVKKVKK